MPSQYRVHSTKLFLTYPQCPLDKKLALDLLLDIFKNRKMEEYVVAEEKHENGDPHLHVYISFEKDDVTYTNSNFADLVYNNIRYHGNYQGCRSMKNVVKYCTKKDNYLSNFDVNYALDQTKLKKRRLATKLINKEINLVEAVQEEPELLFGYKKLKTDLFEFFKDEQDKRTSLPPWLPNPWGKIISSKISNKRRHYWIFSRQPDKGKTFLFAQPLAREYRCLLVSGDYTYWNISGQEEAIILDEYNAAKLKYHELNAMCDGTYGYRVFQAGIQTLNMPLIIVLSNQSILDLYPFMNTLLYARFKEIELI